MRHARDSQPCSLVHLELHTHDASAAGTFYRELLGWRTERLQCPSGTYHGLALGGTVDGGIVECAVQRAIWLPYVEVEELEAITERGRALGAQVLLEPRQGPTGSRSVLATSAGGEIALWQPKGSLVRRIR